MEIKNEPACKREKKTCEVILSGAELRTVSVVEAVRAKGRGSEAREAREELATFYISVVCDHEQLKKKKNI